MDSTAGRSLDELYDLAMLDLDGVVYIDGAAVDGAPRHLAAARAAGLSLAFVTNNAARTPATVATHLTRLGVPADAHDVVTSAQAAARVLADRLGAGAPVAALGAEGLLEGLKEAGLVPVAVDDPAAEAVVNGYGPEVLWRDVMRAAVRVRDGLWWVATNTDMTIPTAYGTAPGNGVLVEAIQRFSGVRPEVAGKPDRPLLDVTIARVGGERALMIGDRLDTDILGGRNAEVDTLLVLTGVTGLTELVRARAEERPTYLAVDLGGLAQEHAVPTVHEGRAELGGWSADADADGALSVAGSGSVDDWWRAVAAAAWWWLDTTGAPVAVGGLEPPVAR